jgi:NAD(P)-dependent dehydrogenase (short-subunit alcohol dehydrogenase family)
VTADVATAAGVGDLVAAAQAELTRLDGFVDIVGQASWATIPELTDGVWERDFAMCLGHARGLSQGLLEMLVRDGGTVLTPRMDDFWSARKKQATAANAPLGRLGATPDIAAAVLYLISDLSSFVTGKTIVVDGGVGSKFPHIVEVDGE